MRQVQKPMFIHYRVILLLPFSFSSAARRVLPVNEGAHINYRLVAPQIPPKKENVNWDFLGFEPPLVMKPLSLAALTSSTSMYGSTTSTTPSTTTTRSTEIPPSRLPPLISPLVPFSNDASPIVGFSLVRAKNSSLHGQRGNDFINKIMNYPDSSWVD